jgi:hypothetical protein
VDGNHGSIFSDPPPPPIGLVLGEGHQPGHTGVSNAQSQIRTHHAFDIQRLELGDTCLGCQQVGNLVKDVVSPLAYLAVDGVDADSLRLAPCRPFFRALNRRWARRSLRSDLRSLRGAVCSIGNPSPSKAVTSVETPGGSGAGRAHSN